MSEGEREALQTVYARFFVEDLTAVKELAQERRIPWQVELRLLVHEAVKRRRRKPELR